MKTAAFFAGLALVIGAGPALAQAPLSENPPTTTIVCLDVGGQTLPAVCKVPGSRIDPREDICLCPSGIRTEAPVCAPGERPPAESVEFERARREAARDGTLVGDTFQGQRMCVAPRTAHHHH